MMPNYFLVLGFFVSFLSGFTALAMAAWSGKRDFIPCLGYALLGFVFGPLFLFVFTIADDHRSRVIGRVVRLALR